MEICAVTEMLTHLTCPAPAKLNLFLHVTGRRADGYHLLQTVFRFIDFADTLISTGKTTNAAHTFKD